MATRVIAPPRPSKREMKYGCLGNCIYFVDVEDCRRAHSQRGLYLLTSNLTASSSAEENISAARVAVKSTKPNPHTRAILLGLASQQASVKGYQ